MFKNSFQTELTRMCTSNFTIENIRSYLMIVTSYEIGASHFYSGLNLLDKQSFCGLFSVQSGGQKQALSGDDQVLVLAKTLKNELPVSHIKHLFTDDLTLEKIRERFSKVDMPANSSFDEALFFLEGAAKKPSFWSVLFEDENKLRDKYARYLWLKSEDNKDKDLGQIKSDQKGSEFINKMMNERQEMKNQIVYVSLMILFFSALVFGFKYYRYLTDKGHRYRKEEEKLFKKNDPIEEFPNLKKFVNMSESQLRSSLLNDHIFTSSIIMFYPDGQVRKKESILSALVFYVGKGNHNLIPRKKYSLRSKKNSL
jgi:hypothetical protein